MSFNRVWRTIEAMKHSLALAVVLACCVPLSGQQTEQRTHPEPIPNWSGDAPQIVPLPNPLPGAVQGRPIPNWRSAPESEIVFSLGPGQRTCAIFRADGKKYRWVEGSVPSDIPSKKQFTNDDLQKIIGRSGLIRILKPGYAKGDLDAERQACAGQITTGVK